MTAIKFSEHFHRRGYPIPLLDTALIAARRIPRSELLKQKTETVETNSEIIMVTRYHPDHDLLREIVTNNWDFLGKSTSTLPLFNKKLMVGYRRPKNLRDLIVRADVRLTPIKTLPQTPTERNIANQLKFLDSNLCTLKQRQSTIKEFLLKKNQ